MTGVERREKGEEMRHAEAHKDKREREGIYIKESLHVILVIITWGNLIMK